MQFASKDPKKEIRTILYGKREENPENLGVPHLLPSLQYANSAKNHMEENRNQKVAEDQII